MPLPPEDDRLLRPDPDATTPDPGDEAAGHQTEQAALQQADEALVQRRVAAEADRRAIFAALLADDPFADEDPDPQDGPPPHVIAVLVAHDGARWLPETLAALAGQSRPPDQVVAVDTGSSDGSAAMLAALVGRPNVVTLPRPTGYGAALAAGLAAGLGAVPAGGPEVPERREWLWLLHDDSAPAPDALAQLIRHARRNPSAAVLGAKAVDWRLQDRLIEVGLTTDSAGRRVTDLEHYELDQGQHDQPRDVLAVGTAGSLIRRDVWDALGGMDPALPLLRDDIDLGWRTMLAGHRVVVVPAARVRHARATQTGLRSRDALPGRLRRQDRAHGLYVHLANRGGLHGGLLGLPLMLFSATLRALVLLLTRRPRAAWDEINAALIVLLHPLRLISGRHRRRAERTRRPRAARPLLSHTGTRVRATLLATTDLFAGPGEAAHAPSAAADDDLPAEDASFLRRLVWRPSIALVAVLTVVGLVAERGLLRHGALQGGRLLPVAPGSSDLWRAYAASWHAGALGSSTPAAPWEPTLAAVSLPFGASPPLALAVLLLGALPLAGLSAWWATRRTSLSVGARLWASATYALLPPLSGAVAGGRFDAEVAIIAAPLLLAGGYRLLTRDPRPGGWNHAFALGLSVALVASFSPPTWVLAGGLLLLGATIVLLRAAVTGGAAPAHGRHTDGLAHGRHTDGLAHGRGSAALSHGRGSAALSHGRGSAARRAAAAVLAVAVAPALLWPYTLLSVQHPRELIVGLGVPGRLAGATGPALRTPELLLVSPGVPTYAPVWLTVPLLLAAAAGLLRRAHRGAAVAAVAAALGALGFAVLVARTGAVRDGHPPYGWPGPAQALAGAALLAAALVAAHRAREALGGRSFGLTQPIGVLITLVALALPVASAAALLRGGAGGPLGKISADPLPPFVLDEALRDPGERILRLSASPGGAVIGYRLEEVAGARLGTAELQPNPATSRLVAQLVADLTSDRGTDAAELLSTFDVRYVALPAADAASVGGVDAVLDDQPALSRVAVPGRTLLWQLLVPSSRAQVLFEPVASAALDPAPLSAALGRGPLLQAVNTVPARPVLAAGEGVNAQIPASPNGGATVLGLADSRDSEWRATVDGRPLEPLMVWGWAQGFRLPPAGGHLTVWHDTGDRHRDLVIQLAVLAVVLVLAAPGVGRRDGNLDPPPAADDAERPLAAEPATVSA